jgi:hypothetical protein
MGFDDPIVKPGRPGASHLHVFFGNVDVNAFSTPDSVATTGRSTCDGGIANRSAYWVPALYDTRTGQPLKPSFSLMYYKTGYGGVKPSEVKAMPSRLRIVAGDPNATGAQPHISWGCLNGGKPDLPGTLSTSCAPGDGALTLAVGFPQCWNGKDLDSPDHQSHMAYASGGCPATHPVALPQITINVRYTITTPGEQRFWRLSSDMYDRSIPGGRSLHGDWMNGWVPEIQQRWISTCQNKSLDCGSELGNGTRLRSE